MAGIDINVVLKAYLSSVIKNKQWSWISPEGNRFTVSDFRFEGAAILLTGTVIFADGFGMELADMRVTPDGMKIITEWIAGGKPDMKKIGDSLSDLIRGIFAMAKATRRSEA